MFGKGSLIVVAGFSLAMSVYSTKMNRLTVTNSEVFNTIFVKSLVHESALSGMNFGVNFVWSSESDSGDFTIVSDPCTTDITIYPVGSDSILVQSISRSYALIEQNFVDTGELTLVSDTIFAWFSRNTPVSRWASYSNQDNGIDWTTGDTSWGPVHCNHNLRLHGTPVFYGKVTARLGISPNPSGNGCNAEFQDGWEIGINAALPTNMNLLRNRASQSNDGAPINTKCLYNTNMFLNFRADGSVIRTLEGSPADTVLLTTIAPAGIIYSTNNVKVSGVLKGVLTILTDASIEIENDLVYSQNPLTNETCEDILGLVAVQNVIVVDNEANNSNVNINGCIFAVNGSFVAQNYADRPVAGRMTVIGSIAQSGRGNVATISPWDNSITHGFSKSFYYDPRLRYLSPPYFPSVDEPRLVSWWE